MPTTTPKTLEDLIKVREWLNEPSHWTKGWYAHNSIGEEIRGFEEDVVNTCLVGACQKARGTSEVDDMVQILETCIPEKLVFIPDFNDHIDTTHEKVLETVDCAIDKARVELADSPR